MRNIQYSFENKHALVTGGGQGIGFEMTKAYLQSGANVTVWDYSQEALDHVQNELAEYRDRLFVQQVDVTNREQIRMAGEKLHQPLTILVNNAGITRDKSFSKMSAEDFDAVISTNLTSLFNVTQGLLTRFEESGDKRIINISSVVALYGNFGQTNYVAAKAGVIGMTKTWARELGRKGFTCNAIAPGFTQTAMVQKMPKEAIESMESKVPVQRLGRPEEIANACLFLSAQESSYINGVTLSVDGGMVV